MARGRPSSIRLARSAEARPILAHGQRSTTLAAGLVRRGQIRLRLAAGRSHSYVAQAVGVQRPVVRKWAGRVLAQRLEGLLAAGPRAVFPPEVAISVVRLACERSDRLGHRLSQGDCAERARQLVADGIVAEISAPTGRRLLAAHPRNPWRHPRWGYPKPLRDAGF